MTEIEMLRQEVARVKAQRDAVETRAERAESALARARASLDGLSSESLAFAEAVEIEARCRSEGWGAAPDHERSDLEWAETLRTLAGQAAAASGEARQRLLVAVAACAKAWHDAH